MPTDVTSSRPVRYALTVTGPRSSVDALLLDLTHLKPEACYLDDRTAHVHFALHYSGGDENELLPLVDLALAHPECTIRGVVVLDFMGSISFNYRTGIDRVLLGLEAVVRGMANLLDATSPEDKVPRYDDLVNKASAIWRRLGGDESLNDCYRRS
ncbi:MAG: hypothetical protein EB084_24575 [Proteobacteria bacterium]|nr:hypothetical protein [Pseudomonadota bacterium]